VGREGGRDPPLRTHEARAVWRWFVAREIPAVAVVHRKPPYRAIFEGGFYVGRLMQSRRGK